MLKKITTLAVFAAAIGLVAANANANTFGGRVTAFSPTSISVLDKEVVTVGMNGDTAFTKLVIKKPWQENTQLTFSALTDGRYVVVHADNGIATWVQVNTDRPVFNNGAFTVFEPRTVVAPAFATEAARHRADAAAFCAAPTASESKRPGSPGTAVHCDRIADRLEKAAGVAPAYAPPANPGSPAPVLQANAGDILSGKDVRDLIAAAKTPAEHRKDRKSVV